MKYLCFTVYKSRHAFHIWQPLCSCVIKLWNILRDGAHISVHLHNSAILNATLHFANIGPHDVCVINECYFSSERDGTQRNGVSNGFQRAVLHCVWLYWVKKLAPLMSTIYLYVIYIIPFSYFSNLFIPLRNFWFFI